MTGKVGTDIEENKCSWLVVQALARVTPEQREILKVGVLSLSVNPAPSKSPSYELGLVTEVVSLPDLYLVSFPVSHSKIFAYSHFSFPAAYKLPCQSLQISLRVHERKISLAVHVVINIFAWQDVSFLCFSTRPTTLARTQPASRG